MTDIFVIWWITFWIYCLVCFAIICWLLVSWSVKFKNIEFKSSWQFHFLNLWWVAVIQSSSQILGSNYPHHLISESLGYLLSIKMYEPHHCLFILVASSTPTTVPPSSMSTTGCRSKLFSTPATTPAIHPCSSTALHSLESTPKASSKTSKKRKVGQEIPSEMRDFFDEQRHFMHEAVSVMKETVTIARERNDLLRDLANVLKRN